MAESERVILDVDEFQFSIWGVANSTEEFATDLADFIRELGFVVVHTGQHYGPAELVVRRCDAPGQLIDEAEDSVEFSVVSNGPLQVAELFGAPVVTLAEAPGSYRLRLSARGRGEGEARYAVENSDELCEHYLIEIWSAPPSGARTLRKRAEIPPPPEPVLRFKAAGHAAAKRIGADVDGAAGAREFSGAQGLVTVTHTFPGTRRRLFKYVADPSGWFTRSCSRTGARPEVGGGYVMAQGIRIDDQWYDVFTGTDGTIRATYTAIDEPRSVTAEWQWFRPITPGDIVWDRQIAVLAAPTRVRASLTESKTADGTISTTVEIEHAALPAEWVDDMRDLWHWQLERADKNFRLGE